jgi:nitrite reductase/ring-hydroxylating ferredoxin subunit
VSQIVSPPPGYRYPVPPFPNGWFAVAHSHELLAGAVMPVAAFGHQMVLFRDGAGAAHLLDAHCPHLGAHLGHGGRLEDGCLRCPFHGWRFDASGRCVEIPYAKKIPPGAQLGAWPVREANGFVLAWHHLGAQPPSWEVPLQPEIDSPEWSEPLRRRWRVRAHNQEMAENAVDVMHFRFLHGAGPEEMVLETEGPKMHVRSKLRFSASLGAAEGTITSCNYGFGFVTTRFTGVVDTLLIACMTPIDGRELDVRFDFRIRKLPDETATANVANMFVGQVAHQLEQDIPIWEHKVMHEQPLLVDGDGPIGPFRKWARQFYVRD